MGAYPDGFSVLEYDVAHAAVGRAHDLIHESARAVGERRLARMGAGAVGIAGVAATIGVSLLQMSARVSFAPPVFLGTVVAAPLTYLVLRGLLRVARSRAREGAPSTSWFDRTESWSFALPLVAVALVVPLALHALVYLVLSWRESTLDVAVHDFGKWINLSFVIVGHAHLALAVLMVRFVRMLRRHRTFELAELPVTRFAWRHVLVTTAVAAVPGIVLLLIPPALVAATAAAFVPLSYSVTRAALLAERRILAARERALAHLEVRIDDLESARAALLADAAV